MIEHYGQGEDAGIRTFILQLAAFLESLPQPQQWLAKAVAQLRDTPEVTVAQLLEELRRELAGQQLHCAQVAAALSAMGPAAAKHAAAVETYAEQLHAWLQASPPHGDYSSPAAARGALDAWEPVLADFRAFKLPTVRGGKLADDDDAGRAVQEQAKSEWKGVRELFNAGLKKAWASFTVDEWLAGLASVAPYTETLVELVQAFGRAYAEEKRRQDVVDFADQERLALELLAEDGDPERPSAVARQLQRRFAYVLVDEFQDASPIQEAIIQLASRERAEGLASNLFVVGDVKQSIYRFRLAEPAVFLRRLAQLADPASAGEAVFLQHNFRSRPTVLAAVNHVFERLMDAEAGGLGYDEQARLVPPDGTDGEASGWPVEVHVLARPVGDDGRSEAQAGEDAGDDADESDDSDAATESADWEASEREAYLIGQRIQALRAEPGCAYEWGDFVVLLRAASGHAERMAAVLESMGIPTRASAQGALLQTREVRDVRAVLALLDNAQQDIPLAAVLRSGLLGEVLTADELAQLRAGERGEPFHVAVQAYARSTSGDPDLQRRVSAVLRRAQRYRTALRSEPVATVLERLLDDSGYPARVLAEPRGRLRYAHLLDLVARARQFSTFRRQGLHRFLRFLDALEQEQRGLRAATSAGGAGGAVAVQSIHSSKGLEYPVVFVAGLGTQFNLQDRSGRLLFEREAGIGLRAVDMDRAIEYATAVHRRVVTEVERQTLAEEQRVLYVAMTRARDRLILVGTDRQVERFGGMGTVAAGMSAPRPTAWQIAHARTPLDWLHACLSPAPAGGAAPPTSPPLFDVAVHEAGEMQAWSLEDVSDPHRQPLYAAVAQADPLPADEPRAPGDSAVEEVLERIDHVYPHLAAASVRAAVAASELGSATPAEAAGAVAQRGGGTGPAALLSPDDVERRAVAQRRGLATHRVLEHLDFAVARDAESLALELQRLGSAGVVTAEELALIAEADLAWLVQTPVADAIRSAGADYHRELPFVAAVPAEAVDPTAGPLPAAEDQVLVRGIIDGVLCTSQMLAVVDYKTDAVAPADVSSRAERYRPQLEQYARAVHWLWGRPVRQAWLVFLAARRVASLDDLRYD